jgi:hypothetical protein
MLRGEGMMITLNSSYLAARTCRARLAASTEEQAVHARVRTTWTELESLGAKVVMSDTGREGPNFTSRCGPWQPWKDTWSDWNPYRPPR